MAYFGNVTVTNKYGWSKTIEINKALFMAGRNPSNDVVLSEEQGFGAAPLHLQLICPRTGESSYRIVNLADSLLEIVSGPSTGTLLKPRTAQEIRSGDVIVLGEFSLSFYLLAARGLSIEQRSTNLGMKLELHHTQLQNGKKLAGVLTLTNHGSTRRCQFTIEVDGLPADCFQVSPAPLLYPGASGEVEFYFAHRITRPKAGKQMVTITASASQAYPLEMVQIPVELTVEPVHKFSLELDKPAAPSVQPYTAMPVPMRPGSVSPEKNSQPVEPAQIAFPVDPASTEKVSSADTTDASEIILNSPSSSKTVISSDAGNSIETAPEPLLPSAQSETTANLVDPQPLPSQEVFMQPEISPEDEQKWLAGQAAVKMPQRQTEPLAGSRRDIRSLLAGREIHVIKAGDEQTGEATEASSEQKAGAE